MKRRPRPVWTTVAIFSLVAGYSVLSPQARANELAWRTYNEAGENFVKQGRYADAEQVLIHALEAAKETKSKEHLRASLELLVKVYDSLKKVDNAKSAREQLSILGFHVPPLPVAAPSATAPASAAVLPVSASPAQGQTGVRAEVPATGIGQGAQSSGQPGKAAFVGSSAPAGGFVAPPVASRTPFTPSNGFASGAAPQVIRFSSVTGQPINAPTSFADSQTAGAANNGTTSAFSPGVPPVDVAPALPTQQQSSDLSAGSQFPSPSSGDVQKAPVDGSSSAAPGGDAEKPSVNGSSSAAPIGAGASPSDSTNALQPVVTSAANEGLSGATPSVPESTLSQSPPGGGIDSGLAQATGSAGPAIANKPSGDAFANASSDAPAAATQQSVGSAASYGSYEDGVEKLKDQAAAVPSPSDNVGGDSEIVDLRGPTVQTSGAADSIKEGAASALATGSSGSLPGATNNQSQPEESLPLRNEIRSAEQKNLAGGSAPSTRIDVKDESADIAELSTAAPKSVDMTDLRTPDPKDSQPTGSSPSADAVMKSDTVSSPADGAPGAVTQSQSVDMSLTPATAGSAKQSAPLDPNYRTSSTPRTEATNPSPASAPSVGSGSSAAQEANPAASTSAAADGTLAVAPDINAAASVVLQPVENLPSSLSLASNSSALPTGSSSLASNSSALPSGSSSLPSSSSATSMDPSNPASSSVDVATASAANAPGDRAESKYPSRDSALSTVSGVAGSTGHAQELRALQGHIDWIKALCFAPDSNFAASGGSDHVIRYWDVNQGKLLAEMPGHRDDVNGLAFSKDGTKLLSASDDKTVRMFDVASQKEEKVLTGHKNLVTCVACSPDLKQAASGGYDNAVILWDLQSGAALATLAGHTATVRSVIFTPDGSRVISSSDDRTIIVWDAKSFKQLYRLQGHESHVLSLDISEDGKRLISGGRDLTARIWDLDSLKQVQVLDGHRDWVLRVKFMKGGSQAVTGSLDKTVRIWDLSIGSLKSAIDGFNLGIWSEDFAADKGLVLTGSNDKTVRVWALGE
ncbi:MAG: hypothetical protein K2X93_12685 [Candidatus Obscuribacterales bacterium]|nr:hypothetical protein [Candidatus Obscuribacterales bacterium]